MAEQITIVDDNDNIIGYKDRDAVTNDDIYRVSDLMVRNSKGEFASIEEVKEHLYKVLDEIGAEVGEQNFIGYPHLLMKKKGML